MVLYNFSMILSESQSQEQINTEQFAKTKPSCMNTPVSDRCQGSDGCHVIPAAAL